MGEGLGGEELDKELMFDVNVDLAIDDRAGLDPGA